MVNTIWQKLHRFLRIDSDPIFKEIFHGSLIILAARVGNAIFQLGINFLVARYFGSPVVGVLAIINSVFTIASIFTLVGTNTAILRLLPEISTKYSAEAAGEVQHHIHRLVLFLSSAISLVTICVIFIWQMIPNSGNERFSIFLIAAAVLPMYSLTRLSTETLRAQQRTVPYAFAHILPSLTNLLFLIPVMVLYPRPEAPLIALVSSMLLVFLLTRGMAFSHFPKRSEATHRESIPSIGDIIRLSLPMGFSMGMQLVMDNMDLLLIGLILSESDAGVYNIASKLSLLTGFIITSINAVSSSRFSQMYFSDQLTDLLNLAKKSSRLIFWTSLPILLILAIFGRVILGIFGQEFTTGYTVLLILVSAEFINAAGGSVGVFLNMTGSHIIYRNILTVAALINITINLILIPTLGILGAGIASLVSLTIINVSASYIIYRQTGSVISYVPTFIRKWSMR